MQHARMMIKEPLATYPEHTIIAQEFDREGVNEILSLMTAENSLITITGKPNLTGVEGKNRERWLGGHYTLQPVKESQKKLWETAEVHNSILLPPQNPLIPENLALLHEKGDGTLPTPKLLDSSDQGMIYYAADDRYLVPETIWILDIVTPAVDRHNAESLVLADLYVKSLEEHLNPFAYRALLAGLDYDVERRGDGVRLTISGYSEKAHRLLTEITSSLRSVTPTPQQFKTYKETLHLSYKNFEKESPLKQAGEQLRTVIYKEYVTSAMKAQAIRKTNYKNFLDFRDRLFDYTFVKGTIYGNVNEEQARGVWRELREAIASDPYPKKDHVKQEAVYLPLHHGPYYLERSLRKMGNAAILMVQNGNYSLKRRAAHQILSTAIEEPFYSELRTQQQTGYMVFSWADVKEKQLYTFFAAQSNSHDTRDLLARFELLIESFVRQIDGEGVTRERFEAFQQATITKLKQPPKNLSEMGAHLHTLAFEQEGDFDWMQKRIQSVSDLTFEEFLQHATESYGKSNRQRLAVLMNGDIDTSDYLSYSRLRSSRHLKKMSEYLTKEEALALENKASATGKQQAKRDPIKQVEASRLPGQRR